MLRAVIQHLPAYINLTTEGSTDNVEATTKDFKKDVKALHRCTSNSIFEDAVQAMAMKWGEHTVCLGLYQGTPVRRKELTEDFIQKSATFNELVHEVLECCEDFAWGKEPEEDRASLKRATEAAKWALQLDVIYTDESASYYMVPSKALLQSAANQEVVDSMVAQLYLRHQGAAAAEWDDWSQIRTTIENILIIDARPGMRYSCTCYQSKQAKKTKKTCDHSLGVKLLVQGHLGPYQIQDLLDFGPKSVGRPK
ncbi:hypothetical protein FOZ60_010737 [Perkinsus olseni]|uniref:SWIM-type domain-containing protein n=1 Tax=Perkinsus olseni TaxID=32597 RepID=A0A7J6NET3_PEROL|nr:hypothetical protein FOZ60_010737 [Perkinsus olseni]